jgi:hypothetical protein
MTKRKDAQIRTLKRQLRKAFLREWLWRDRAVTAQIDLELAADDLDFVDEIRAHQFQRDMGRLH